MAKDKFASEIGSRIAARRKQLGLTQAQTAEKAGLTQQFFASVEIGLKNMRAESIVKVSNALNVSTDYILKGVVTDIDRERIVQALEPLKPAQFMELEEIISRVLKFRGDK